MSLEGNYFFMNNWGVFKIVFEKVLMLIKFKFNL